jgi:hypothetical protein
MLFNSTFCQKYCNTPLKPTRVRAIPNVPERDRPKNITRTVTTPKPVPKTLDVQPVSLRAMSMYAQRGLTVHQVSLRHVEDALKEKPEDPTVELPVELKEYQDVFSPKEAEKLPPHRPYDHDIKLKDGQTPP